MALTFDPNMVNTALSMTGGQPVYGSSPGLSGGGQMDPATADRLRKQAAASGMQRQAEFAENIPGGMIGGASGTDVAKATAITNGGLDPAAEAMSDADAAAYYNKMNGDNYWTPEKMGAERRGGPGGSMDPSKMSGSGTQADPYKASTVNSQPAKVADGTENAEDPKKNQKEAMGKIGSILGAIGNFYSGNYVGAAQSAQGLMGGNKKA